MTSDNLTVIVNIDIYRQEVITSAIYKFTGEYYVSQEKVKTGIQVTFAAKSGQVADLDILSKEFENALIDQQIRYDTEQKFGHIRDMIVEEAFKPVSK